MDEVDILDYWYMILNRRKVVAVVTVAAVFLALVYVMLAPATYEASALVIFPPQPASGSSMLAQLSGVQSLIGGQAQTSPSYYAQILKSRRLRTNIQGRLGLDKLDVTNDEVKESLRITIPRDGGLQVTCSTSTSWFGKTGGDAKDKAALMAADMANAYVNELQAFDQTESNATGRKNRIFIESELRKTKDRLSSAEEDFKRFRERNPSVVPVDQSAPVMNQLAEVKAKQLSTQAERDEADKRLNSTLSAYAGEDREILSARVLSNNPIMMDLRGKLVELEIKKAKLLEDFTEKHPDVVAVDEEIAKTRDKMASDLQARITSSETLSVNPIYQKLQDQIVTLQVEKTGLEARESALGNVIHRMEQDLTSAAGKQMTYVRLLRDMKALEQVYTTLLGEYSKAQITEAKEASNFEVLDWAEKPKIPVSPKKKLMVAAAMVFGLGLGSLLAIGLESMPQRNRRAKKTIAAIEEQTTTR